MEDDQIRELVRNASAKLKEQDKRPSLRRLVYHGLTMAGFTDTMARLKVVNLHYVLPPGTTLMERAEEVLAEKLKEKS